MLDMPPIPLFDMIMCFMKAVDLVSPQVVDHHSRVAYIASHLAAEFGLPPDEQTDLVIAGAFHDVGALSLKDRLDALSFEGDTHNMHAELGSRLMLGFGPVSNAAMMVRYHHTPWSGGAGTECRGEKVPIGSHVLHLADRVDVLISRKDPIYRQVGSICSKVEYNSGGLFAPELVKAFLSLARDDSFWADAASESVLPVLAERTASSSIMLDGDGLLGFSSLMSRIIDFRSRYTSLHSGGVAGSAVALAGRFGFSGEERLTARVAGYLHDLGKLGVSAEILEKPGSLTAGETAVVKRHPLWTNDTLKDITGFETINAWAAYHHERMDGAGYPFGRGSKELPLGSRILAVSDVFTALMEDRPYRAGMDEEAAISTIEEMAGDGALDPEVVEALKEGFDEVNEARMMSQGAEYKEYIEFGQPLN